ncbi:redoxin domain-containing protein [Acetobacter sp. AN02]|uniref:redoxin family protein n=1 Tax=Acetobacter sp. AN02 TaxID=2894186 RepID=UPI002434653F|nr:redoxin family protein [Acetobacter sp. AN02]MDG6094568.1 redoxin domain-containing protein [Acetobacter sp. AN02]
MSDQPSPSPSRRRLLMALPVVAAGGAGVAFWRMLSGMSSGTFNPHDINAPATGKAVPEFERLPDQDPGQGFSSAELRLQTSPVLVNFFASWCIPCIAEMQALLELRNTVPIWGIAYKDKPENASGFIRRAGNPYVKIASDRQGRVAIDWGVSGVPESFLIAPGGGIAWHSAGGLDNSAVRADLSATLKRLSA